MVNYNRRAHLKQLHQQRKVKTYIKVNDATKKLIRANENINFNSVASEAGVSKATLYNHSDLRERIETLRQQQSQSDWRRSLTMKMAFTIRDN